MSEPIVSVIVPNYNGAWYLAECLWSLHEQSFREAEIIVVDNGSSDDSAELVERCYPDVTLIRLESNKGFSAAVNAGIEAARGEFIIILNNDTRAERQFIGELHRALSGERAAAMAAPKMLFARSPDMINSLGLGYSITGCNHDIGFGLKDGPQFDERMWIFGPCGGAGMYRRSLFEDVGRFDEDFFMYYEDVDFSFRAQLRGYRCVFVPTARVYHAEGGSGASLPKSRNYYFARNSLAVILKNFPGRLLLKHFHVILWEIVKRAGSPVLKGDPSAIMGYLAGARRVVGVLKKRRGVQRSRRVPESYIEEMLVRNRLVVRQIDLRGRPVEEHL